MSRDDETYLARVEAESAKLLRDAPPLTDEQKRRLADLLPAVEQETDDQP